MKNLEQLRVAAAMRFWQEQAHRDFRGPAARASLASLIHRIYQQGLLSAISAIKAADTGMPPDKAGDLLLEVGRLLAMRERGLLPLPVNSLDDLLRALSQSSVVQLQQATLESLNYLGVLKRLCLAQNSSVNNPEGSSRQS